MADALTGQLVEFVIETNCEPGDIIRIDFNSPNHEYDAQQCSTPNETFYFYRYFNARGTYTVRVELWIPDTTKPGYMKLVAVVNQGVLIDQNFEGDPTKYCVVQDATHSHGGAHNYMNDEYVPDLCSASCQFHDDGNGTFYGSDGQTYVQSGGGFVPA